MMNGSPVASTAMLIRKPVSEVFNAFIDPDVTTKFWFTDASGKLEKGAQVNWNWRMYNHTAVVMVKDIIQDKKIEITWGAEGAPRLRVEWTFEPRNNNQFTFVSIVSDGFKGDDASVTEQIADNVGGFCWVLAGLKAWLEFGIQLNLVADRFPSGK